MKKLLIFLLTMTLLLCLIGCAARSSATDQGQPRPYSQLQDGAWECDGQLYKYKLEVSGRMPDAAADSTFVYLSNLEEITFEQAWKAAGLSSDTEDYFSAEEAVLVNWIINK